MMKHVQTPTLIIVTGHPATGKTTLSRALASGLRLPLLSKDTFKELMFDGLVGSGMVTKRWGYSDFNPLPYGCNDSEQWSIAHCRKQLSR
jgi:adenylylsulfate kinase-like enzyme